MTKIALLGAGGKMGVRLATNLHGTAFKVDHVEISDEGRERLKSAIGATCIDQEQALAAADVVLMAVPDRLIGKIAHTFIDKLKPGAAIIMLDAAAPYAGELPKRDDVDLLRHPPLPPADLQRRSRARREDRLLRRHRRQAAHRLRPDAGAGGALRPVRGGRPRRSTRR